jgi:mycothiol synthase
MTTQTRTTMRPYAGEADLPAILDLLNTCDAQDQLDDNYSLDSLRRRLDEPPVDKARDLRRWEDAGGRLAGFGQLWYPPPNPADDVVDGGIYFRVHPERRNQGLEDEIIAWGAGRALELGQARGLPAQLVAAIRETNPAYVAYRRPILERHGFAPVRYGYKMARPLTEPLPEAQMPDGFTLRTTAGEAEWERWVEAFNLAFIDHWNFHPWTMEQHRHWVADPNYRADLDLVAVAPDSTFAAFCMCLIDPEDNTRNGRQEGWITDLGTRRGYRKIGLGRAMLRAGMQRLQAAGMDTAVLGVDAENPTGALRLYESVGFTPVVTTVTYRKDL